MRPHSARRAWPTRALAALLALGLLTQGCTSAVQRTMSQVHFHITTAEPAPAPTPTPSTAQVVTDPSTRAASPREADVQDHDLPQAHDHDHAGHRRAPLDTVRRPRLFVHTYELDVPTPSRQRAVVAHGHTDHAELAHHAHAADAHGVVYVDAVATGSLPPRPAGLGRDLSDLDSLAPQAADRPHTTWRHAPPGARALAMHSHVAPVPLRPPRA
ncbi:MAG: hypothetical protein RL375_1017 [Pseudomonadota bacterium]|jgi:hypothetical protein